jgi:hypothetical protein
MDRVRHAAGVLFGLILLTSAPGLSQQQSTSGTTQVPDAAAQSPDTSTGSGQQEPNPAATSGSFFIRALNSANPLEEESGPLHWGWFSVRSASFFQYYAHVNFSDPSVQTKSEIIRSSQLSATLVVDHNFKAAHFSLQYEPSLFITNGNVYSNALNQTVGLDTTFTLSSRWSLQVTDRFSYYASQRYFSDTSLDTNYLTGATVQKNFLNGPGSVMVNSITAPISYLWSPRTTVSFAPSFDYQYSKGAVASDHASLRALYEGGRFTLSHLVSPTQTIGINYLGQYATFKNTLPHAGPQSSAFLEDFLLTYTKQVGATWHFGLGMGVSDNIGLGNGNTSGGALLAVNAGITKAFHRTDFTVAYNRGHQFNGFITSQASDRIDATQRIHWTRRFSTITSVAYYKTTTALPPSESASYATERVSFDLTRQLSLSASGSYVKQVGDGVFVASGIRRFATVGITWSPQSATATGY